MKGKAGQRDSIVFRRYNVFFVSLFFSLVIHLGLAYWVCSLEPQKSQSLVQPPVALTIITPKPAPVEPLPVAAPSIEKQQLSLPQKPLPTASPRKKKPQKSQDLPPKNATTTQSPSNTTQNATPTPQFGLPAEALQGEEGLAVPSGDTLGAPIHAKAVASLPEPPPPPPPVVKTPPKLLSDSIASYPRDLRQQKIQGQVLLLLKIDATGKVQESNVIQSLHPRLDESALIASRRLRFTPATQNGIKVPTQISYRYLFVLD